MPNTKNLPIRRGAVAVIVRAERYLVIRRSQTVSAPGFYCFPGGGIEVGESESEAVIRELQEELGIVVAPIARVWRSVTPWRIDLAWWLAEMADDAIITPNPDEVESAHWFTAGEILELPKLLTTNREFILGVIGGEIGRGNNERSAKSESLDN